MGNTIYASFNDASLAEKAAGALLDHGVRAEDVSVVRGNNDIREEGAYTATSPLPVNEQAWTGENRNTETERLSYTGNINYSGDPNLSVPPTYEELNSTNQSFGTVAADASTADRDYNFSEPENIARRDATVYPEDRVIENQDAMTTTAVGHDPNNWPREDHNRGDIERAAKSGISTTTGADAGAGAVKGLGWGAGIGVIAAIASLAVPGFGLVLGAGALATAIGGVAATAGAGAIAGGITGYLKDQGMEEHVAANYSKTVENGGALIAVTFPSGNITEVEIREVLEKYGANVNVNTRGYVA